MGRPKKGGISAIGKAKARFLHPLKAIQTKCNEAGLTYKTHIFNDALTTGKELCCINGREQLCYLIRPPLMDDNVIYHIVWSNVSILTAAKTLFPNELAPAAPPTLELRVSTTNVDVKQAAPKNTLSDTTLYTRKWEFPTTCPCKADSNINNEKGKYNFFLGPSSLTWSCLMSFRMCMSEDFNLHMMIPATNKHIKGEQLTLPELYKWLGCCFFMACFVGISPMMVWRSKKPISMFEGAPFRLNEVMSLSRFQAIHKAIRYTNKPTPTDFNDPFHDMRQLRSAFNDHYAQNYLPSYLLWIDKNMNTWLDQSCPGFVSVEWIKIQEGKDRPMKDGKPAYPYQFESKSKTVMLMLDMTLPIHGTGKIASIDSGFCVSAGILALHDKEVFGQALIKKQSRYWPKGVPVDDINNHFQPKKVGELIGCSKRWRASSFCFIVIKRISMFAKL
ncbi:hypothetical protein ACHAW6_003948 [Cyclotella cf. meneghiniana]